MELKLNALKNSKEAIEGITIDRGNEGEFCSFTHSKAQILQKERFFFIKLKKARWCSG